MAFLHMLADLRTPLLDRIALLVTNFGDETLPLIIALLIFWCTDKRWGYRMIATVLMTLCIALTTKVLVMEPRPWVLDPSLSPVAAAVGRAQDYSFPSGHSAIAGALFCSLALFTKKKSLKVIFPLCALLVAFSRMYLGVHTPTDVLVGLTIGFSVPLILTPIVAYTDKSPKATTVMHLVMILLLAVSVAVQINKPASPRAVTEQDTVTLLDTCSLLGAGVALALAHWIERSHIRFDGTKSIPAVLIRLVGGFAIVMVVRVVLKAALPSTAWSNALRYFTMVIAGAAVWPLLFPKIDKLVSHTKN